MIYIKKLLNTELKYDSETEKLFRFHKRKKCFTLIDPNIKYDEYVNKFIYNTIRIDNKMLLIHRVIYHVCNDDFNIFDKNVTIDHRNVNHLDNRLGNLRTATHAEQARNKLNWGGELVKGYRILNDGRKKKYQGYYTNKNGKQIMKYFLTESEAKSFHDNNTERF